MGDARWWYGCGLLYALACGGSDRGEQGSQGDTGAEEDDGASADDGSDGADGDDGADGTKYDLPPVMDVAGDGEGCKKVDFLFVIDRSNSMDEEQQALIASFPGFISTIRDTLDAEDLHIMVVDTDDVTTHCWPECEDNMFFNCQGHTCDEHQVPGTCNGTLGAGRVEDTVQQPCAGTTSDRFLTDQNPTLESTFACIAEVGLAGSLNETQAGAMVGAVSADLNGAGGCNEGFLRSDAILVVTLISDEDDMYSMGDSQSWKQALLAAKADDEEAIVMLGLLGDTGQPGSLCQPWGTPGDVPTARDAVNLRELFESFSRGQWFSVCEPSYNSFFTDAVATIDTACDEFVPPG